MLKKSRKAFTLVELLIVLIVIGILAGLMMVSSGSATDKAQETRCVADRRSIKSAINIYRAEHGSYDGFGDKLKDMFDNYHGSDPVTDKIEGICSSGGTYTIASADDKITITCSEHDDTIVVTADDIILALAKLSKSGSADSALFEYFLQHGSPTGNTKTYLDSFSTGAAEITHLLEQQLGISLAGYSWMAVDFGGSNTNYSVYLTNQDLSRFNAGDKITVTKYETSTGKSITIETKVGLGANGNKVICHVQTDIMKVAIDGKNKRT